MGVWQVSFGCLEGVLRVSGGARVSMGCLNGNLLSQDKSSQDRSSQDRSSKDRSSKDRSRQVSGVCLAGALRVSQRCLDSVWRVSMGWDGM